MTVLILKCANCGKNPRPENRQTCDPCAAKRRAASAKTYANKKAGIFLPAHRPPKNKQPEPLPWCF